VGLLDSHGRHRAGDGEADLNEAFDQAQNDRELLVGAGAAGFAVLTPLLAIGLEWLRPLNAPIITINGEARHGVWSWVAWLALAAFALVLSLSYLQGRKVGDTPGPVGAETLRLWGRGMFAYMVVLLIAVTVAWFFGFSR
jgi:hypothetical protein